MKENLPYLTEDEKERFKMCLGNIQDKLTALQTEAQNKHAYKSYIEEKIDVILNDASVIKHLTNME